MRKFNSAQVAGYVFDGVLLQRARVRGDQIVNSVTGQPIDFIPSMSVWYTQRNVQNALARLTPKGGAPVSLVTVGITPELVKQIGGPRQLKDHVLHLMTAGVRRILEREFTAQEVKEFEEAADKIVNALDAAYQPTVVVPAKKSA